MDKWERLKEWVKRRTGCRTPADYLAVLEKMNEFEQQEPDLEALRDEMAKAALTGQLAAEPADEEFDLTFVARRAYKAADAMLAARKEQPNA